MGFPTVTEAATGTTGVGGSGRGSAALEEEGGAGARKRVNKLQWPVLATITTWDTTITGAVAVEAVAIEGVLGAR